MMAACLFASNQRFIQKIRDVQNLEFPRHGFLQARADLHDAAGVARHNSRRSGAENILHFAGLQALSHFGFR
jgi:hypothetical protein